MKTRQATNMQTMTTQREAPVSPARQVLAGLRRELRAASAKTAAAGAPVARLEALIAGAAIEESARTEIRLGAAERLAAWAESGVGAAPELEIAHPAARAEAVKDRLAATEDALTVARRRLADAAAGEAELADRVPQATAAVLREDGAARLAEYWRLYARFESLRRELAALDQVLLADFPAIHPATRRPILAFLSPERLSAGDAMRAAETAVAGLAQVNDFTRAWREAAANA